MFAISLVTLDVSGHYKVNAYLIGLSGTGFV